MRFRSEPRGIDGREVYRWLRALAFKGVGDVGVRLLHAAGIPMAVPIGIEAHGVVTGRIQITDEPRSGPEGYFTVSVDADDSIIVGDDFTTYQVGDRKVDRLIISGVTLTESELISDEAEDQPTLDETEDDDLPHEHERDDY